MDHKSIRDGPGRRKRGLRRIERPAAASGHPQTTSESACVYDNASGGGL